MIYFLKNNHDQSIIKLPMIGFADLPENVPINATKTVAYLLYRHMSLVLCSKRCTQDSNLWKKHSQRGVNYSYQLSSYPNQNLKKVYSMMINMR